MTPEEAISIAFRAASRGMAHGISSQKAEAYEGFLVQTNDSVKNSAKGFATVAKYRPDATTDEQIAMLEMHAYNQILQATVSCLMALGHFPYLDNIDATLVKDKFDG